MHCIPSPTTTPTNQPSPTHNTPQQPNQHRASAAPVAEAYTTARTTGVEPSELVAFLTSSPDIMRYVGSVNTCVGGSVRHQISMK